MKKLDKKIMEAIEVILKEIKHNAINKSHRHAELNWDCPECKFRMLEGGLEWFKDLLVWDLKLNQKSNKKTKSKN